MAKAIERGEYKGRVAVMDLHGLGWKHMHKEGEENENTILIFFPLWTHFSLSPCRIKFAQTSDSHRRIKLP